MIYFLDSKNLLFLIFSVFIGANGARICVTILNHKNAHPCQKMHPFAHPYSAKKIFHTYALNQNFDCQLFFYYLIIISFQTASQSHFFQKIQKPPHHKVALIVSKFEFLFGGGEGSRTPVRKSIHRSFSECSHCLFSYSPLSPMT